MQIFFIKHYYRSKNILLLMGDFWDFSHIFVFIT